MGVDIIIDVERNVFFSFYVFFLLVEGNFEIIGEIFNYIEVVGICLLVFGEKIFF